MDLARCRRGNQRSDLPVLLQRFPQCVVEAMDYRCHTNQPRSGHIYLPTDVYSSIKFGGPEESAHNIRVVYLPIPPLSVAA